jgi:hypothetical protein
MSLPPLKILAKTNKKTLNKIPLALPNLLTILHILPYLITLRQKTAKTLIHPSHPLHPYLPNFMPNINRSIILKIPKKSKEK